MTPSREKGLSIVPTRMYLKNGRIKCEIAVAKGKKFHDKREAERAKDGRRRGPRSRSREQSSSANTEGRDYEWN